MVISESTLFERKRDCDFRISHGIYCWRFVFVCVQRPIRGLIEFKVSARGSRVAVQDAIVSRDAKCKMQNDVFMRNQTNWLHRRSQAFTSVHKRLHKNTHRGMVDLFRRFLLAGSN